MLDLLKSIGEYNTRKTGNLAGGSLATTEHSSGVRGWRTFPVVGLARPTGNEEMTWLVNPPTR